jgi:carboxypeptidase D
MDMKSILTLLTLFLISLQAFADEQIVAKVKIPIPQGGLHETAIKHNLDIERGGPDFVFGYLTESEQSILRTEGISFDVVFGDYRQETAWVMSLFDFGEYHTHEEVVFFLDSVTTANPNICRLDTLGYSFEDRIIMGIRISDNPGVEEDEPEVRIMGAHHGDEKISVELPLYMIDLLTTGYGDDDLVTRLVNSTEIFIIPMVNPDGVTHNSRRNSRNQDINRDYLCPEGDYCPAGANNQNSFSEQETQAVRLDALANRYTLSLTMHAGATNINAVWNYDDGLHHSGQYHPTPDDDLVMFLSYGYAERNYTPGFYVTNGCDWYSTHGDANDFSYGWLSDIDWTIEISQVKTPPENQIEDFWIENVDAMLYIIDMADIGIRGVVTDSVTGEPLDATVRIVEGGFPFYTDPSVGDYHRPLLPGAYNIRVESPGYISAEIGPIDVYEGPAQRYDFQLAPAEMSILNIAVNDSAGGLPLEANISIRSAEVDTLFFFDGHPMTVTLDSDIYDITVFSPGYQPVFDHALLTGTVEKSYSLPAYSVELFSDDFEGDLDGWLFGGTNNFWGIADTGFYSQQSLEDSPGYYSSNSYNYARIDRIFDLTPCESAGIYFVEKHYFQPYYDFIFTQISTDGGSSWATLPDTLTGFSGAGWYDHFIPLDEYCGAGFDNVAFRYYLNSNSQITYDGVYIDCFYFGAVSSSSGIDNPVQLPEEIVLGQNYPNPFNASTSIIVSGNERAEYMDLEIYDILGRLIRTLEPISEKGNLYIWHGLDNSDNPVSSGIYFYRLSNDKETHRMTLLK